MQPGKWWYLSDLAKTLKTTPSALQRDIAAMANVELLEKRKEGNRVYYRANSHCIIYPELQRLLVKTSGIADRIKEVLLGKNLRSKIRVAFIYGSVAREEEISSSDIDVMIIGQVKLKEMVVKLKNVQSELQREINPTIYTEDEFARRIAEKNHFILDVLENEKIFLIGDEDALRQIRK